jgi:Neuraminidase (sialidase)
VFSLFLFAPSGATNAAQNFPDADLKTIHTLDVYAENKTIHLLLSGLDKKSKQLVLRYLNSSDSGETWSVPISLNQGVAPVKQSRRGNDFQIAAYGDKVMAIWKTKGGEPWTGIIVAALSRDQGKTWHKIPSPVSDKYSKIDQGYFDVTADSQGKFHITWLDDREEAGDTQGLRYASYMDDKKVGTWERHKDLEASVCTCCWSTITTDNNGNIHVLYRDDKPRDMMLISSNNGGNSWQKPGAVWPFGWEFVGCPHQGGGIAVADKGGKIVLHSVVWNGNASNRGLYYSQSGLAKGKWSPIVSVGDKTSASGDIAVLDNKRIGIVYTTGDAEKKQVMAKVSEDGSKSWLKERRLTSEGVDALHPRIVSTPDGFRVFWTEWLENGDAKGMMAAF